MAGDRQATSHPASRGRPRHGGSAWCCCSGSRSGAIRPLAVLRLAVPVIWTSVVAGSTSRACLQQKTSLPPSTGLPPTIRSACRPARRAPVHVRDQPDAGYAARGHRRIGTSHLHCLDVGSPCCRSSRRKSAARGGTGCRSGRCGPRVAARQRIRIGMSPEFLVAIAGFVMITVVIGLARSCGARATPTASWAAQLLGTGGIASLLLVGVARDLPRPWTLRSAGDARGVRLDRIRQGPLRSAGRSTRGARGDERAAHLFTVVALVLGAVSSSRRGRTAALPRHPVATARPDQGDNVGLGLIVHRPAAAGRSVLAALKLLLVWLLVLLAGRRRGR